MCRGFRRFRASRCRTAFGTRVSGFGFRVSGFGFWVLGFRFRVSVQGSFRIPGFGFRVSVPGVGVPGFRFRVAVQGFGFKVSGSDVDGGWVEQKHVLVRGYIWG